MQNSQNKKKLQIVLLVLVAVLTLSIGYASITAVNLIINGNGTATANQENFKVYFTNSSITEGKGTVSIDEDDPTIGYFDITGLSKAGDYAEATYTVLNNSNGVGAQITLQLTNSNLDYFKVTEIIEDDKLQAGEDTTVTVKVEMIKTPLNDAVSTSITATLKASPLENDSATGGSPASKVKPGVPTSFAADDWDVIQKAVQDNNTSVYNVGDTKTITINGTNYTVRIANKTTNEKCINENYSQTACGFVVEFAEIVENRAMNSTATNIGGWPGSDLHTYLNGTFYNSPPNDLKAVIIPTRVISGFGCNDYDWDNNICINQDNDGNNYTSIDNLYILSGTEVHGNDTTDMAANSTHQLNYYVGMPKETHRPCSFCDEYYSYPKAEKKYQGISESYWLRESIYTSSNNFGAIYPAGALGGSNANDVDIGLVPAFRIG